MIETSAGQGGALRRGTGVDDYASCDVCGAEEYSHTVSLCTEIERDRITFSMEVRQFAACVRQDGHSCRR